MQPHERLVARALAGHLRRMGHGEGCGLSGRVIALAPPVSSPIAPSRRFHKILKETGTATVEEQSTDIADPNDIGAPA